MFLLTEGPHFYYVDPQGMDLKGEIPWWVTHVAYSMIVDVLLAELCLLYTVRI
jgi:hypothetical protein